MASHIPYLGSVRLPLPIPLAIGFALKPSLMNWCERMIPFRLFALQNASEMSGLQREKGNMLRKSATRTNSASEYTLVRKRNTNSRSMSPAQTRGCCRRPGRPNGRRAYASQVRSRRGTERGMMQFRYRDRIASSEPDGSDHTA